MVSDSSVAARPNLVVFDLCDTLYDANTTVDFIRHYQAMRNDRAIARVLRRWLSKASPFFYLGALAHRLFKIDIARKKIIASLAGHSKARLEEAASDYARKMLPLRANQLLHDRLNEHIAAGDRVILLSSSLDLIASEVAIMLGVEYRASELEFDGDSCTGQLKKDLTGRKLDAIRDQINFAPMTCVYTDNRSDRDIIAIAERATIIIPRGAPDDHWGGSSCEYIRL